MGHYAAQDLPASEIEVGDLVLDRRKQEWEIVQVGTTKPDFVLVLCRKGRTVHQPVAPQQIWTVHKKIHSGQSIVESTVDESTMDSEHHDQLTDEHITVQTYLFGRGMSPERLETAAKTFGTVLAAQYRKRYGKAAKAPTRLEYVHYLDTEGEWENACAVPAARRREFGWYESRCYGPQDRDLMDAVADGRNLKLEPYRDPAERALDVLREQFDVDVVEPRGDTAGELLWLAESQIRQCLASGLPCSHEACSRRRGGAYRVAGSPHGPQRTDMFEE